MGLFRRRRQASVNTSDEVAVDIVAAEDDYDIEVVGESHYQDNLCKVAGAGSHHVALLVPEPGNQWDRNAIEVVIMGLRVGYVARAQAADLLPILAEDMRERGCLIGVPCTISGDRFLGVFLRRSLIGDEPDWRVRVK